MKPVNLLLAIGIVLLPVSALAREESPPEMEMLEFLGSFETARGKPIDPRAFAETPRKKSADRERSSGSSFVEKDGKQRTTPEKREKKDRYDEK